MSTGTDFGKGATGAELDDLCVNTIRMLAIDAVEKAKCGHPGMPMGCADFAYVLWTQFLKFDPSNPKWEDRDRFVLSAGHGSMLLYAILHLTGHDISLDDIKNFRQWESKTAGHPEFGVAPGVDATTGPLGQGISNAVGMAIAETFLAATFNKGSDNIVDHFTYTLCSDGDLQEGVAAEAVSLAGHLGLGKLIAFYDNNHISIEGPTSLAYSDNVRARFEGYNWHVQEIDGHNRDQIAAAIRAAQDETDKPSIIIATTTIGYGSPNKANTGDVHGSALGPEETKLTKKNLGWPEDAQFLVPDSVKARFAPVAANGRDAGTAWQSKLAAWKSAHDRKGKLWDQFWSNELPANLKRKLPKFEAGTAAATRKSAGQVLAALMDHVPNLIGGSADLAPSTNTFIKKYGAYSKENRAGRNFHFGIREHGMGAILNGMAYHGGVRPFGATFFVFSDYMRPSIRLAALCHLNPIYVFTHDSVFLGEDGPTHQPVEHLASLRAMPNLKVIRPADGAECAEAWLAALQNTSGPTALVLSRQNLPNLDRKALKKADGLHNGAYKLGGKGSITILASGSEVSLALKVSELLKSKNGTESKVVSVPSWELFDAQDEKYQKRTLGGAKRVAIEAGVRQGWDRYLGPKGLFIGIDRFGTSAPDKVIAEKYGLTAEQIVNDKILPWLHQK